MPTSLPRRHLLALLLAAPCGVARAAPRTPRLGILRVSPPRASYEQAFVDALARQGFTVGTTLDVDDRHASGDVSRLPSLAAALVAGKPDAIFARGAPPLFAARHATATIPIVAYDDTVDPVAEGLVATWAHPGGNVTGVFMQASKLVGKWIELVRAMLPDARRVGVLWAAAGGTEARDAAVRIGSRQGLAMVVHPVADAAALERAFAALDRAPVQALLVLPSQLARIESAWIARYALARRLPAVSEYRDFPEQGGLMSYGPFLPDSYGLCAVQIAKVLRGTPAATIPLQQPYRLSLVINRATLGQLGITLPRAIVLEASEFL